MTTATASAATSTTVDAVLTQLDDKYGLRSVRLHYGLSQDDLFHAAIANDRGRVELDGPEDAQKAFATSLGVDGPLVYYSDPTCTGRPVQDTFAVARDSVVDTVWWKPGFAQYATHAYFCNIMFPKNVRDDSDRAEAGWTLINVPSFECDPDRDGTRSARAVIIDIETRTALVLGKADYCGVNKKTMFTLMNYVLPEKGQLSMHCSANVGSDGDTAILFGLSGTGKTTLSADPHRLLIGELLRQADRPRQGQRAGHRRRDVDEGHVDRERAGRARPGDRRHRPAGL